MLLNSIYSMIQYIFVPIYSGVQIASALLAPVKNITAWPFNHFTLSACSSVCVCVWERERERVCVCVWERERVCVCVCVCVCISVYECVYVLIIWSDPQGGGCLVRFNFVKYQGSWSQREHVSSTSCHDGFAYSRWHSASASAWPSPSACRDRAARGAPGPWEPHQHRDTVLLTRSCSFVGAETEIELQWCFIRHLYSVVLHDIPVTLLLKYIRFLISLVLVL